MMTREDVHSISWGNHEVDRKIGALPYPALILVEGANDSGKSVVVQQATYGALTAGRKVRYITTENTVRSFVEQMRSQSFDVTKHFLSGRLKILGLHVEGLDWDSSVSKKFLYAIGRYLSFEVQSDVYILDSLTYLVTHAEPDDVLTFFSFIRNLVDRARKLVMVTLHPYAFNQDLLIRVRSICDGHLVLEIKNVGDRVLRMMAASKMRGATQNSPGILAFEVDPAFGMKVVPFSQARA